MDVVLSICSFYICMKDKILIKKYIHISDIICTIIQTLSKVIKMWKTFAKPHMANNASGFGKLFHYLLSYTLSTPSITYYHRLCVNYFRCVGLVTPLGWTAVSRVPVWELAYRTLTLSSTWALWRQSAVTRASLSRTPLTVSKKLSSTGIYSLG